MGAVSNYTHCRGCGVELPAEASSRDDGLCCHAEGDCTDKCAMWHDLYDKDEKQLTARFGPQFWKSPLWSVAIDEWLAATR